MVDWRRRIMTYTQIGIMSIVIAALLDMYVLRTRLVQRKAFWYSYLIIFFFQLISNGVLTGLGIVQYDGAAIIGETSPTNRAPTFIGHGRLCFAPVEDLMFGFSLILLTMSLWVFWGQRGVQRTPMAGPPRPEVHKMLRYKP